MPIQRAFRSLNPFKKSLEGAPSRPALHRRGPSGIQAFAPSAGLTRSETARSSITQLHTSSIVPSRSWSADADVSFRATRLTGDCADSGAISSCAKSTASCPAARPGRDAYACRRRLKGSNGAGRRCVNWRRCRTRPRPGRCCFKPADLESFPPRKVHSFPQGGGSGPRPNH
jgi:hypothetical protein